MRRVAVFGNAGGGKSRLASRLAAITGLPLHVIAIIQFRAGRYDPDAPDGGKLTGDAFRALRRAILAEEAWIIDGFGGQDAIRDRITVAQTLVHVDLPALQHDWDITRRSIGGGCATPRAGRRTARSDPGPATAIA